VRRRAKVKASGLDEVPRSFSPRKGCSGQAKSRKAPVERRSAGPSVEVSSNPVGLKSSSSNPRKARGAPGLSNVNRVREKSGPWFGGDGAAARRLPDRVAGRHSRARNAASSFAPSADGRRELVASAKRIERRSCHTNGSAVRLQGRKTLASHPGKAAARTALPERETDGER